MELPELRNNLPDLRAIGIHPDFWYPVALARELKPRATLATTFAGEPIVLARTDTGSVFALEDRCAHRQGPPHLCVGPGGQRQSCFRCLGYEPHLQPHRPPLL